MKNDFSEKLICSLKDKKGSVNSTSDILKWIKRKNSEIFVDIKQISLHSCKGWHFNNVLGIIENLNGGFFSIQGIQSYKNNELISEQPIIVQNEIGYLGIISKEINGTINFLMQAKIEPGNINKIQISPTIQATKSNLSQLHKGRKPLYLEYFINAHKYRVIIDQLQSEQASRFYKKRNRNILIFLDESEEIEISPNHIWMTLGQIKDLLKHNNLINMDTRTVISHLSISSDSSRCLSFTKVFNVINNVKMFSDIEHKLVDLRELLEWSIQDDEIVSKQSRDFKVIFCDINIEGREVQRWCQPMLKANGIALYGLVCALINGKRKYLVKIKMECGNFDKVELGPTIQLEFTELMNAINKENCIQTIFLNKLFKKEGIVHDVLLSEEGGRFYQEQNRNVILELKNEAYLNLPITDEHIWLEYDDLNLLIQHNNLLNIQLRNLLSLVGFKND